MLGSSMFVNAFESSKSYAEPESEKNAPKTHRSSFNTLSSFLIVSASAAVSLEEWSMWYCTSFNSLVNTSRITSFTLKTGNLCKNEIKNTAAINKWELARSRKLPWNDWPLDCVLWIKCTYFSLNDGRIEYVLPDGVVVVSVILARSPSSPHHTLESYVLK